MLRYFLHVLYDALADRALGIAVAELLSHRYT
jgi:hypothetical protein